MSVGPYKTRISNLYIAMRHKDFGVSYHSSGRQVGIVPSSSKSTFLRTTHPDWHPSFIDESNIQVP